GAFTADEEKLYYVDLERQAVFSLDLAAIEGDVGQGLQGSDPRPLKPMILFAADGYIDDISVAGDGGSLEIDWIRQGSHGEIQPATYLYSLEKRTLDLLRERKVEQAGAAMKNLHDSAARPFLHGARLDAPTGYSYGLIRLGSRSLPARMAGDGNIEVLDSPLLFLRSLLPQWRRGTDEGGLKIALSATLSGGISRLVILEERADGWKLYLQKEAPEGGVHLPILVQKGKVIYRANLGEGRQELRIAPVDSQRLSASFERLEATWIPLEEMRKKLLPAGEDASAKRVQVEVAALRPTLFPRLCASSRYPYADAESAGLVFKGSDLTERLAWTASAGWNFAAGFPEAAIALGLSVDEHYLSLAAADRALPASGSTPASRLSGVSLGHSVYRILMPVYDYVFASSAASLTGIQSGYA
ncbi:MAG TPA: hypothetical protein VN437_01015, partial [Rectinemataceae bacterium]|nr:hypothetical protein [Rectinemataceae bacterium]